jgi:hypothetical protein
MDVRSERLRRALEIIEPEFKPTEWLAFQSSIGETTVRCRRRSVTTHSWQASGSYPFLACSRVEALLCRRPWELARLGRWSIPRSSTIAKSSAALPRLTLDPSSRGRGDAAEAALRSIDLTKDFAPVVVFGHEHVSPAMRKAASCSAGRVADMEP